jgi:hypothetical protein
LCRQPPTRPFKTGNSWISQVPRKPQYASAMFPDTGQARTSGHLNALGAVPAIPTTKTPTIKYFRCSIAWLLQMLSTLRATITGDYARLAYGWWPTFTVPAPGRVGFYSEFQLAHPLTQGLSWRQGILILDFFQFYSEGFSFRNERR